MYCYVDFCQGELITTAGWYLYVWTINCEPIAFINTAVTSSQQTYMSHLTLPQPTTPSVRNSTFASGTINNSTGMTGSVNMTAAAASFGGGASTGGITCLAASELNEWNSDNVILTGSADGVVRVSCPIAITKSYRSNY